MVVVEDVLSSRYKALRVLVTCVQDFGHMYEVAGAMPHGGGMALRLDPVGFPVLLPASGPLPRP